MRALPWHPGCGAPVSIPRNFRRNHGLGGNAACLVPIRQSRSRIFILMETKLDTKLIAGQR
jgi:hypothetical protein